MGMGPSVLPNYSGQELKYSILGYREKCLLLVGAMVGIAVGIRELK